MRQAERRSARCCVAILDGPHRVRHTRAEEEAGRARAARRRRGRPARPADRRRSSSPSAPASLLGAAHRARPDRRPGCRRAARCAFGLALGRRRRGVRRGRRRRRAAHRQRPRGATGIADGGAAASSTSCAPSATPPPRPGRAGCRWLSPIGWGQQIRPYAGDRWWVAAGARSCSSWWRSAWRLALAGPARPRRRAAPARPGPATAGRGLRSPLALAWRLQRGSLLAWLVGVLRARPSCSATWPPSVGGLLDSPEAQDLITRMGGVQGLTDAFLGTEFGAAGVVAAAYGVQAALRLRGRSRPCAPSRCWRPPSPGRPGWPATWWWRWPRRRP